MLLIDLLSIRLQMGWSNHVYLFYSYLTWLPLWLEKLEKLEKLEFGVIFEKGLEKLEKDIIFKAVELEKLDFHLWVRNIFMKCFTCMFIYL